MLHYHTFMTAVKLTFSQVTVASYMYPEERGVIRYLSESYRDPHSPRPA